MEGLFRENKLQQSAHFKKPTNTTNITKSRNITFN